MENSSTRANVEEQGIMFQRNTILPWVKRWESEFNRKLFIGNDSAYYIRFNMDGLLRGDIRSRYEAYTKGRQWGWISANDVRKFENLAPIEGGDAYLQPMNMVEVGRPQNDEDDAVE
jgi:HK97 family phage portal protein